MPERREKLTFARFVDWGFLSLLVGITAYGATTVSDLSSSIRGLQDKLSQVIAQMAAVQAVSNSQNARLDRIENHIDDLEKRASAR